jgi:hypothetical protein
MRCAPTTVHGFGEAFANAVAFAAGKVVKVANAPR